MGNTDLNKELTETTKPRLSKMSTIAIFVAAPLAVLATLVDIPIISEVYAFFYDMGYAVGAALKSFFAGGNP